MPMHALKDALASAPSAILLRAPEEVPHTEDMAGFVDPLDEDEASDAPLITTRRGLMRLALIASETGARFQREGLKLDPMAWMIAPRDLFEGRPAVEACLERGACVRALVLHGLGCGLDANPTVLDDLASDEEPDVGPERDGIDARSDADLDDVVLERLLRDAQGIGEPRGRRLFTSTAASEGDDGWTQLFHATVAASREEAVGHLRADHGDAAADAAETIVGFRPDLPLAHALVSPAIADMLAQIGRDPASPLAAGLRVSIQQRFAA